MNDIRTCHGERIVVRSGTVEAIATEAKGTKVAGKDVRRTNDFDGQKASIRRTGNTRRVVVPCRGWPHPYTCMVAAARKPPERRKANARTTKKPTKKKHKGGHSEAEKKPLRGKSWDHDMNDMSDIRTCHGERVIVRSGPVEAGDKNKRQETLWGRIKTEEGRMKRQGLCSKGGKHEAYVYRVSMEETAIHTQPIQMFLLAGSKKQESRQAKNHRRPRYPYVRKYQGESLRAFQK